MSDEYDETGSISMIKVCLDARDPDRVADFWVALLGYRLRKDPADDRWRHLEPPRPGLPPITIQPVPEAKSVKNRLHLDIFVRDPWPLIAKGRRLGASLLERSEDPADWYQVMADPEGNELCICQLPPP